MVIFFGNYCVQTKGCSADLWVAATNVVGANDTGKNATLAYAVGQIAGVSFIVVISHWTETYKSVWESRANQDGDSRFPRFYN